MMLRAIGCMLLFAACGLLGGCGDYFTSGGDDDDNNVGGAYVVSASNHPGELIGITADNVLISFDAGRANSLTSAIQITGLATGETFHAIDVRPSTGEVYGVSTANRIYLINQTTGVAAAIGTAALSPTLSGTAFDMDFDPVADRIRIVSDTGQSLRVNPADGSAIVDPVLAYAAGDVNVGQTPNIVAAGYALNFVGAVTTTLYEIDASRDALVTQGNVNATPVDPDQGQLFTVGTLGTGVDAGSVSGFEITNYGAAFMLINPTGSTNSQLYSIDLSTGAARLLGSVTGSPTVTDITSRPPRSPRVVGLSSTNRLVTFAPGAPDTLLTNVAITGLQSGETIVGIDFRPSTGDLYGVGSTSRLYRLNATTGAATVVGTTAFAPTISGNFFGADFNPVADRLRLISDADQSLRINPATGTVAGSDTALTYAPGDTNAGFNPNITAAAYTGNIAGSTATTLYGIDSLRNALVIQGSPNGTPNSPNTGLLTTVAPISVFFSPIPVDPDDNIGFDISVYGGAIISFNQVGSTTTAIGSLNLATGVIRLLGFVNASVTLRDLAIEPPDSPRVFAVNTSNTLVSFAIGDPATILSTVAITGLANMEQMLSIDVRPGTRVLIGVGSSSRIYQINPTTGAAVAIGSSAFTPAIMGTSVAADFNPTVDRLRFITEMDQNLAIDPTTGQSSATNTNLTFASGDPNSAANPSVVACAYTNNFSGASSTTLYGIDSGVDSLVTVGSINGTPNSPGTGICQTVAPLTISGTTPNLTAVAGFDISAIGTAVIVANTEILPMVTATIVGTLDLTTGVLTPTGSVPQTVGNLRCVAAMAPGM